jgi:hypothetical protein
LDMMRILRETQLMVDVVESDVHDGVFFLSSLLQSLTLRLLDSSDQHITGPI